MKRQFALFALLLFGWLAAWPAHADWKEVHKLGLEAVDAGRWADAERFFRSAIEERSEEKVNRFLKTAYLPHYYLGIALAEQGQCRAAIKAWNESLRQEQIQRSKQLDDLEQRNKKCQSFLRQVETAATEVKQLLTTVQVSATSVEDLSKTPDLAPVWDEGSPSLRELQQRASRQLTEARQKFDQGKRENLLDLLESSKALANQAQTGFETTTVAARQRISELDNAATGEALQTLEQAEISSRRVLRSIADLAPYPSILGARVAAVEQALKSVVDSKSGANPSRLSQLTDELTVALAALRRSARRPPEKLRQAVEAFFSASYDLVLELTDDSKLKSESRMRAHVCLLRAASRHALWVLGGEGDNGGRDLIAKEIIACADIDPPLAPDSKFFSPRFLEIHTLVLEEANALGDETGSQDETDSHGAEDTIQTAADSSEPQSSAGPRPDA